MTKRRGRAQEELGLRHQGHGIEARLKATPPPQEDIPLPNHSTFGSAAQECSRKGIKSGPDRKAVGFKKESDGRLQTSHLQALGSQHGLQLWSDVHEATLKAE